MLELELELDGLLSAEPDALSVAVATIVDSEDNVEAPIEPVTGVVVVAPPAVDMALADRPVYGEGSVVATVPAVILTSSSSSAQSQPSDP